MKTLIALALALSSQAFATVKLTGTDAKNLMEALEVPTTTKSTDFYTDVITNEGYDFVCTKRTFNVGGVDYFCVINADVTVTSEGIELGGLDENNTNVLADMLVSATPSAKYKEVMKTAKVEVSEATFGKIVSRLYKTTFCTSMTSQYRVFFKP